MPAVYLTCGCSSIDHQAAPPVLWPRRASRNGSSSVGLLSPIGAYLEQVKGGPCGGSGCSRASKMLEQKGGRSTTSHHVQPASVTLSASHEGWSAYAEQPAERMVRLKMALKVLTCQQADM